MRSAEQPRRQSKRDKSRRRPLWRQAERVYTFHRAASQTARESERNDSKSRKILGRAALASGPIPPPHLSLLNYLCDGSGERINLRGQIRPSERFWFSVPGLYVPPISRARRQPKRDTSRGTPLRRQVPRDKKSPRFFVAPPAPAVSKILEPLAFPKGSKISGILEPLGSPQEAF